MPAVQDRGRTHKPKPKPLPAAPKLGARPPIRPLPPAPKLRARPPISRATAPNFPRAVPTRPGRTTGKVAHPQAGTHPTAVPRVAKTNKPPVVRSKAWLARKAQRDLHRQQGAVRRAAKVQKTLGPGVAVRGGKVLTGRDVRKVQASATTRARARERDYVSEGAAVRHAAYTQDQDARRVAEDYARYGPKRKISTKNDKKEGSAIAAATIPGTGVRVIPKSVTDAIGYTGGTVKNAPKDLGELAITTPSTVIHQQEMVAKAIVKAAKTGSPKPLIKEAERQGKENIYEPTKKVVTHPLKSFHDRPITTLLTVAPFARVPGLAAGRVARVTGKQTLARPDATLPGTTLRAQRTGSRSYFKRRRQAAYDAEHGAPVISTEPGGKLRPTEGERRVDEAYDRHVQHKQAAEQSAIKDEAKKTKGMPKDERAEAIQTRAEGARGGAHQHTQREFAHEFGTHHYVEHPPETSPELEVAEAVRDMAETAHKAAQAEEAAAAKAAPKPKKPKKAKVPKVTPAEPVTPAAAGTPDLTGKAQVSRHYTVDQRVYHKTHGQGVIHQDSRGKYPVFDNGTTGTTSTRVWPVKEPAAPAAAPAVSRQLPGQLPRATDPALSTTPAPIASMLRIVKTDSGRYQVHGPIEGGRLGGYAHQPEGDFGVSRTKTFKSEKAAQVELQKIADQITADERSAARVRDLAGKMPKPVLSKDLPAAIEAAVEEGGGTLHPYTGQPATTGHAVGAGSGSSITPKAKWDSDAEHRKATINQFLDDHAEGFEEPGAHVGVWHDTTHGEVVLDRSHVVADRAEAIRLGRERDEQSVYDIGGNEEIPTGGTGGRQEAVGDVRATEAAVPDDQAGAGRVRGADRAADRAAAEGRPAAAEGQAPKLTEITGRNLDEAHRLVEAARAKHEAQGPRIVKPPNPQEMGGVIHPSFAEAKMVSDEIETSGLFEPSIVELEGETPGSTQGYAVVPKAFAERYAHHGRIESASTAAKLLRLATRQFRRTVLPTSPRWLLGQVVEGAFRAGTAGVMPWDYHRGKKILAEQARREDTKATSLNQRTVSGGLHGISGPMAELAADKTPRTLGEEFAGTPLQRTGERVTAFGAKTGPKQIRGGYRHLTNLVFRDINGRFEQAVKTGMLGKAAKRGPLMEHEKLLGLSDRAIKDATDGLQGTSAQVALGREIDRMYGTYSKHGPHLRNFMMHSTPFIPWYMNMVKFLGNVLPKDHPVLTAALANANEADKEWRKQHRLSLYGDHVPDFMLGMAATGGKGFTAAGRYMPFMPGEWYGSLAGQYLPWLQSPLMNAAGVDWTGHELRGMNQGQLAANSALSLVESLVPLVGPADRVLGLGEHYVRGKKAKKSVIQGRTVKQGLGETFNPIRSIGESGVGGAKKRGGFGGGGFGGGGFGGGGFGGGGFGGP